MRVTPGYWRHSAASMRTYYCKTSPNQDWTPCQGGEDAGGDGVGYCVNATDGGYAGPRCEVCVAQNHYFDQLDARCHDCGDVVLRSGVAFSVLPLPFLAAAGLGVFVTRRVRIRLVETLLRVLWRQGHLFMNLWHKAGMRCKLKSMIGFYQCVAAAPSVFNVVTPRGLEEYTRWISLIEVPADFGIDLIVRASCLG